MLGRLGGKARAKALSSEEIAKIGSKGGRIRAKNLTAEQRSEIARKAVHTRIAKHKQQRRKKESE